MSSIQNVGFRGADIEISAFPAAFFGFGDKKLNW
jgi:hypothetical protein